MKTVLLTGAAGSIGLETLKELVKYAFEQLNPKWYE